MAKSSKNKNPKPTEMPKTGIALTPAACVNVTAASFDEFIPDVDTPLGRDATSPAERRQTRKYCEGEWDAFDISAINRVRGQEPGWGMTRF